MDVLIRILDERDNHGAGGGVSYLVQGSYQFDLNPVIAFSLECLFDGGNSVPGLQNAKSDSGIFSQAFIR